MIIVSQDKKNIVNFDNIGRIYVMKYPNEKPDLRCSTLPDLEIILGSYETEERAKEVLQEIIKIILKIKETNETAGLFGFSRMLYDTYYQMPED